MCAGPNYSRTFDRIAILLLDIIWLTRHLVGDFGIMKAAIALEKWNCKSELTTPGRPADLGT